MKLKGRREKAIKILVEAPGEKSQRKPNQAKRSQPTEATQANRTQHEILNLCT